MSEYSKHFLEALVGPMSERLRDAAGNPSQPTTWIPSYNTETVLIMSKSSENISFRHWDILGVQWCVLWTLWPGKSGVRFASWNPYVGLLPTWVRNYKTFKFDRASDILDRLGNRKSPCHGAAAANYEQMAAREGGDIFTITRDTRVLKLNRIAQDFLQALAKTQKTRLIAISEESGVLWQCYD